MSNAYITEPPTKGKVIFHTTAGPLEVELWPKETPKACRNFVQLCLEGYYDDTIFHRVVKDFIVQGGDPTGTGTGGESCYGSPFADEFHSRLRFSHRGILAMANTGQDENGSQFFFTLARSDDLNRKNTIFGKVVGDTIYNLLKIGEAEVDAEDRPVYPIKIIRMEVLANPFDDIVPRTTPEERAAKAQELQHLTKEKLAVSKHKGKRDLRLLSFDHEDVASTVGTKIRSSHDVLVDDPRLSQQSALGDANEHSLGHMGSKVTASGAVRSSHTNEEKEFDDRMREEVTKRQNAPLKMPHKRHESNLTKIQDETKKLEEEIRAMSSIRASTRATQSDAEERTRAKARNTKYVEVIRTEYARSGKAVSAKRRKIKDEKDTLAMLEQFQSKLRQIQPVPVTTMLNGGDPCKTHNVQNCQSCEDTFGKQDEDTEEGWLATTLVFQKETGANVYQPRVEDYTVIDPRAGANAGEPAVMKQRERTRRQPLRD
ncbi:Peptidyl-prolyl isomerase cwc27 [Gaertneriomyces sp. JEL0708]|nr:Peptidyl-prolyl isomerase cwc27 [Gaertneriomyces sp. JEL0708]